MYKSLRGPLGAMIFFSKGIQKSTKKGKEIPYELEHKINFSVFPPHQGGLHNHTHLSLGSSFEAVPVTRVQRVPEDYGEQCQGFCFSIGGTADFKLVSDGIPSSFDKSFMILKC